MEDLATRLALACRILWMEGHGDSYLGHVTARLEGEAYLMKPSVLGLEEVRPEDVVTIDWTGRRLAGFRPVHGEHPIHTEVYRVRPEVNAVVHTHPVYATALAATGEGLVPLNHDGAPFYPGVPVYPEAKLITRREQGEAMARALGSGPGLLLKNHGIVCVGRTLPEAVFHALSLDRAARVQLAARGMGAGTVKLTADEAANIYRPGDPERYEVIWDYYVRKLARQGLAIA